ncbi:Ankyrin repeat domain-containing protein 50 [Hondaea fermentalgiana]|uniref:Ankyrin repeat domain-containing protein 50 n=1 Tax=Hondaea fermentalgiana TaxID=2315210 RepID=A0A2R5G9T1_9STRA|nr:Ankyrin repeat domain-containing protein 50 [Hondaea fermentalgiana]|eukprot:GBG24831.1 Ankyrin repeat domain-containing protein 50 [Hondaea fermentalgiana]
MFEAIQRLDLEGAIDVIEEDELDVCARNGVAPPRGMRKVEQRSELINFEDAYGMTPLLLACRIGAGRVVMGLLLRGADANKENKLGVTPLIACAKYGNVNAANALLKKGVGYDVAQVLRENKRGETAFDHILASAKSKLEPAFDAAAALEEDGNKTLLSFKRIRKDQSIRKRQVAVLVSKLVGGIRNAHNTGTARHLERTPLAAAVRLQAFVRGVLVFPLRCTPVIVGRSSPSDILVGADDDDEAEKSRPRLVSKRHLILHLDSLGAELVDLSTNGTYINGHRVDRSEPRRLAHGDVLALGARDGPRFTFYVKNRSTSATDGVRTSKNL